MSKDPSFLLIYKRFNELAMLTRANISTAVHQTQILIPDLRNIVVEYTTEPDVLKAYRLNINYDSISDLYLLDVNKMVKCYNINTIICAYNLYDAILKMEKEITRQYNLKQIKSPYFPLIVDIDNLNSTKNKYGLDCNFNDLKIINYYIEGVINDFNDPQSALYIIESPLVLYL